MALGTVYNTRARAEGALAKFIQMMHMARKI